MQHEYTRLLYSGLRGCDSRRKGRIWSEVEISCETLTVHFSLVCHIYFHYTTPVLSLSVL